MHIEFTTLAGNYIRLEPLAPSHADDLALAIDEPSIWRFLPARPQSVDDIRKMIDGTQQLATAGTGFAYALIDQASGTAIGSSGYWNLAPEHLRLEIGMTWIAKEFQRTAANTEMKLLMVGHAFDSIGCERVEFKTDARNQKSRDALRRIGATEEGTLRSHMRYPDGECRDSVYFSIIRDDWPTVKQHLAKLLDTG